MVTDSPLGVSLVQIFSARLSAFSLEDDEGGDAPGRAQARRSDAFLRSLLSRFTGLPPGQLPLGRSPLGKPLLPESFGLWFSLSHSGDRCLAAVARFPVGIDLEADLPRKDPLALARRFLLPEEAAIVAAAPPEAQSSAFLRLWTKKEAFLKGCGMGLLRPLRSFRFVRQEGSPWERVDPPEPDGTPWAVRSRACANGFLCALAVSHASPDGLALRIEKFSPGDRTCGGGSARTLSVDERN